jgi:hypothetical protein
VGHTRLRLSGWGSPNSNDWRKSLSLCLLCGTDRGKECGSGEREGSYFCPCCGRGDGESHSSLKWRREEGGGDSNLVNEALLGIADAPGTKRSNMEADIS